LVSGNLSFLTASLFVRRRIIEQHGLYFDPRFRISGDAEWAVRLIQTNARLARLREFTSAFTETGSNLALDEKIKDEWKTLGAMAPWWARAFPRLVVAHYRLRRMLSGAYSPRPHEYAIYTEDSPEQRKSFRVDRPTYRWVR
jgi:hypothetical protein